MHAIKIPIEDHGGKPDLPAESARGRILDPRRPRFLIY